MLNKKGEREKKYEKTYEEIVVVPYLYMRHSVVIEIAACCESLATNGTFCEVYYD